MKHHQLIREYYECFRRRDRSRLVELLQSDLDYKSPFGNWNDRDTMLDAIWSHVGSVWAVEIEIFGTGPAYMVRYCHSTDSAPRLAEYFYFEEDRIAKIEVYLGTGAVPEGQ